MILRRLSANLRSQNWVAIVIEFVLVILGVFLGIAAANWNEERLAKRETRELLSQLDTELTGFQRYLGILNDYYAVTARYADRAEAGWKGEPSVSDGDFVIAAYQASQINAATNNADVWGTIFGAENLRDIEDPEVRRLLARIMTFDYGLTDLRSVSTRYREEVRKVIPQSVQRAIRDRCGDRGVGFELSLPATCDLKLDPAEAARTAAALRARTDLVAELNWHRAAVANQLANVNALNDISANLTKRLGGER